MWGMWSFRDKTTRSLTSMGGPSEFSDELRLREIDHFLNTCTFCVWVCRWERFSSLP